MPKFPKDSPKKRVLKAFSLLGFQVLREREHISLERENPDGSRTPATLPNHTRIKGTTLRSICRQARIDRDEFLDAFRQA